MGERKIYKTMQGKTIDFDSLRLSNELTPAVGNMKVNARGDEILSNGTIVKTRDEIFSENTKKEIKKSQEFNEDFSPDPEISPDEARAILEKNRKNREKK